MSRNASPKNGDGLDAPHDQPAKTLTKRTTDFIALCTAMVLNDYRLVLLVWVIAVQAFLMALGMFI
jgi:hypothetical protein